MAKRSKTTLFEGRAGEVAKRLIGRTLERYVAGQEPMRARIVVTGAYEGTTNTGNRQQRLYAAPGQIYTMVQQGNPYFVIGTESADKPSVVVVIGAQLETPSGLELIVGRSNVAKALEIDERFDGLSLDEIPDLVIKGRGAAASNITPVPDDARIGMGRGAANVRYSGNCIGIYALASLPVMVSEKGRGEVPL